MTTLTSITTASKRTIEDSLDLEYEKLVTEMDVYNKKEASFSTKERKLDS